MAVEFARTQAVPKPWGVIDLRPWIRAANDGIPIGEVWYDRPGTPGLKPSLLLKLLFTSQPLSIQVHPDDAFAQSMGLPNGKAEAWYVLNAAPGAKVALGLKSRQTQEQLRKAADDGSISDLVVWRTASVDDAIFVPPGTIHAIGAGFVIAEIQQRCDATFRLFDHGRRRALHVESAVAAAKPGPADFQVRPHQLTNERTLLVSSPHFVFERIDLPPSTTWSLEAEQETWLLTLGGSATAGAFAVAAGDAIFAQSERVDIRTADKGIAVLAAHAGAGPVPRLLQRVGQQGAADAKLPPQVRAPPLTRTTAAMAKEPMDIVQ